MKIGITGGIGSGKSFVSKIIEESGYLVLNADDIAKQIMLEDESVRELIISEFGENSYINDELNRKYIASKAFSSVENVNILNSIVHPPMVEKINELLTDELKRSKIVFVEAALIYEAEIDEILDYVLLVTSDESVRSKRIMERDNITETEIRDRMQFQMSENEKENLADFTIKNNSSIMDLEMKTKMFISIFESMSK
ncbi:MAG: dephospho-CoA kinase [Bacteroidetes bacterium]|nr:dephospho-CoA kinase [Bacteroidota bacterium]MBU1114414.1 dephospho-CoA kinase [Bacteroidota bacterium]MBU1798817.1 dephospho-CoA kinase [Bacteroidota bacterium]